MTLSPHFTVAELTRSDYAARKGIDNSPTVEVLANLQMLASGLERVRNLLAVPVVVSSGYRCPKLNSAIGGSRNSAHMSGLAADFAAPQYGSPKEVAERIVDFADEIGFDQLILEFPPDGWVHIAFSDEPRGSVLTATTQGGGTRYEDGLHA